MSQGTFAPINVIIFFSLLEKKGTMFNKNDFKLLMGFVLVAVALFIVVKITQTSGSYAKVLVNGQEYGTYSLDKDTEVLIESDLGKNYMIIKDGKCYLEEADCPDKLCVLQGAIDKDGQSIICLPHLVVITIYSDEKSEYDSIAQ